jgi:hypothetical protein
MSQRTAASGVTARIQTETIKKVRSNVRCVTIDVHSSLDTVAKAFLHHRLQIFRTLTGDFGDGMEAMSHSDFASFGLFAGIARGAFWESCNTIGTLRPADGL